MGEFFNERDLYPDVRSCLAELKRRGFLVGIAGNQTARAGTLIRELHLPADLVATSDDWGAAKPSLAFFDQLVAAAGFDRDDILYVGDRVDNDVLPAHHAGLRTAWIRRGPWGYVRGSHPDLDVVDLRLESESLGRLPDLINVAA